MKFYKIIRKIKLEKEQNPHRREMPAAGEDGDATSRVYVTGVVLREEVPLVVFFTFPLVSSWFSIYSISGFLVPVEGQQLRQPNKAHKTAETKQS